MWQRSLLRINRPHGKRGCRPPCSIVAALLQDSIEGSFEFVATWDAFNINEVWIKKHSACCSAEGAGRRGGLLIQPANAMWTLNNIKPNISSRPLRWGDCLQEQNPSNIAHCSNVKSCLTLSRPLHTYFTLLHKDRKKGYVSFDKSLSARWVYWRMLTTSWVGFTESFGAFSKLYQDTDTIPNQSYLNMITNIELAGP